MLNENYPLGQLVRGADALNLVNAIISEVGDWVRVVQEEQTKQAVIQAETEVRIAAIQHDGELLLGYLDRSFDERQELFKGHFEALRLALQSGSTDQVAAILGAITTLAVKSPFEDLKDIQSIRATWADSNAVIEI